MKPFETTATPATPEKKEMMEETSIAPEEKPGEEPEENFVPDKNPEPVATASPDGSLSVTPTALERMMPVAEAEQKIHEAYLRGRQEAVEAHWDTPAQGHVAPGVASDPSLSLFQLRKSVWG